MSIKNAHSDGGDDALAGSAGGGGAAPLGGLHLSSTGDVVPVLGQIVGYHRGGCSVELPLSASAPDLFAQRNGAALVAGFGLIAPHILVQIGEAVYTFWTFRGPINGTSAPPVVLQGAV